MKNKDYSQYPLTKHVKQPLLGVVFGVLITSSVLAWTVTTLPYYSIFFMYAAISLAVLLGISTIWLNIKPSLWASFIKHTSLSILCSLLSFRFLNHIMPKLFIVLSVIIASTVLIAILLPTQKISVTKYIKSELLYPSPLIGMLVYRYLFPVIVLFGAVGLSLYVAFGGVLDQLVISAFFIGPLGWVTALIIPFSSEYSQSQ